MEEMEATAGETQSPSTFGFMLKEQLYLCDSVDNLFPVTTNTKHCIRLSSIFLTSTSCLQYSLQK